MIGVMRLREFSIVGLVLSANFAFSQQVGIVDLTQPEPGLVEAQTKSNQLPAGCTQMTAGIIADGAVTADDRRPRRISLEIDKLISNTIEVDGEGRAEVQLKNIGETPIQIPSSKDSSVIKAPSPDHLEWEQGNFEVVLRDKQNHTIALKSTEWPLFGSRFVTGSQTTINPGEWITAFLSFKVEDIYHTTKSTEFPIGEAKLFVEWQQARREWNRVGCTWNRAWFDYEGYYKQEHSTTAVQIKQPGSNR